jgi:hypothetical protein
MGSIDLILTPLLDRRWDCTRCGEL